MAARGGGKHSVKHMLIATPVNYRLQPRYMHTAVHRLVTKPREVGRPHLLLHHPQLGRIAIVNERHAGAVVAAILKTLQAADEDCGGLPVPNVRHDAAHL